MRENAVVQNKSERRTSYRSGNFSHGQGKGLSLNVTFLLRFEAKHQHKELTMRWDLIPLSLVAISEVYTSAKSVE
jgi:hypothetical protein